MSESLLGEFRTGKFHVNGEGEIQHDSTCVGEGGGGSKSGFRFEVENGRCLNHARLQLGSSSISLTSF